MILWTREALRLLLAILAGLLIGWLGWNGPGWGWRWAC